MRVRSIPSPCRSPRYNDLRIPQHLSAKFSLASLSCSDSTSALIFRWPKTHTYPRTYTDIQSNNNGASARDTNNSDGRRTIHKENAVGNNKRCKTACSSIRVDKTFKVRSLGRRKCLPIGCSRSVSQSRAVRKRPPPAAVQRQEERQQLLAPQDCHRLPLCRAVPPAACRTGHGGCPRGSAAGSRCTPTLTFQTPG